MSRKNYKPATKRDMDKIMHIILSSVPESEVLWQSDVFAMIIEALGPRAESALMALVGMKCIECPIDTSSKRVRVSVTHKGWSYFETRRQEKFDLWIRGIVLPLVVAILGTLFTNFAWQALQGIEDPPTQSQQQQLSRPTEEQR